MLESLPLELQAYILVFLPAQTLVRTLSLTNHHFHDLVEAHVQRYCLRYLGLGSHSTNPDEAAVLEFEAQRPIDTVTAKHTLQFSHFAAVSPSSYHAKLPPLSSAAVFEFAQGSSSRVATDSERLRSGFGVGRGRGYSVSVRPERARVGGGGGGSGGGAQYVATPFQPFLPGLHEDDQRRAANQMVVSSSLDLEERRTGRPALSRNPSAASRATSRSSSTASTSRARAIAQEIASAPFPFLRHSIEAANRHQMHRAASNSSQPRQAAGTTYVAQPLEEPLDAYDWAGPPGTRAAPSGLSSSRLPRRAADQPACYAFQLDPLDSFESLILTLTARRSVADAQATISAMLRGEDASGGVRLRYSKALAEGIDRVFRDWFRPKPSATGELEPDSQLLEFDTPSCTLSIQPHASPLAHVTHPALASTSSHDYLSRPPLSTQYATLASNERVELTFHCSCIKINAARLLATLERLESDVLANQARSRLALSRLPRIVAGGGMRIAPGSALVNANVGYFMVGQAPRTGA
ncbi:hypothetical protein PHSY_001330 [Pseudozyma hubeiensis SY62]|uniref:F-box domain-containing protein n=1 Tax=Pseudozyma hubeiensis (strain SY62) TaxID=1305764 RepID=R9P6P9_PSEHS|nr:hypothetical protein PHSY_001330 [Pseudozyma hubeiensis SY62]GAC93765.1 hypothetical protein PHSY_001330 [Pseudozyma hubeiensis SY62]